MRPVGIGVDKFENLRKNGIFYVDKTDFIREWWNSNDYVTLITRPRRFGKTLNMDMVKCFFSKAYKDRGDLFEGLNIWKDPKFQELQGSWPVLFLSFANVKKATYEEAVSRIRADISKLYTDHRYLLESNLLSDYEKETFYASCKSNMPGIETDIAVQKLMEYLYRETNKGVIMLLDEYDTPMHEAWVNGYWSKMIYEIRGIFNTTFKTNPYHERGLLTGITSVTKESIFSDLNNLRVVTTTGKDYAAAFGFTEQEVFAALEEYGLSEHQNDVKKWYDGYTFGDIHDIYNPWSVIYYLRDHETKNYWANSSSNDLVSKLVREGNIEIKTSLEDLLTGKSLTCCLDEEVVFSQLSQDENALWSLLLASGYLRAEKVEKQELSDGDIENIYTLALTNIEVLSMFKKQVHGWFNGNGKRYYNSFLLSLFQGNLENMNKYMNLVACQVFSYFDTGTGNQTSNTNKPELFYHGFVLGLVVDLKERYIITSNRESGDGRYDVVLEPRNTVDPAFVFEFKVRTRKENTLKETALLALKQIEDKQYDTDLTARGIAAERIHHYGFAFEGKRVLIMDQSSKADADAYVKRNE